MPGAFNGIRQGPDEARIRSRRRTDTPEDNKSNRMVVGSHRTIALQHRDLHRGLAVFYRDTCVRPPGWDGGVLNALNKRTFLSQAYEHDVAQEEVTLIKECYHPALQRLHQKLVAKRTPRHTTLRTPIARRS